ncbi:DedA family protein [Candidatus Kaiserbacteria bacterium]|nr:DedA family protein [Candidatus Kaiserbacteria bacterium]
MLETNETIKNPKLLGAARRVGTVLNSRFGLWGLGVISFIESALPIPIITDPFLIACIVANKTTALRAVVVTTLASVLGGVVAYFVAVGFFEVVLVPYLGSATQEVILSTAAQFEGGAFLLTLIGAVTPIPYTFVALAAGLVQAPLSVFVVASLLGRGFRYGFEGFLFYHVGERAKVLIKKEIGISSLIAVVLVVLYLFFKFG